MVVWVLTEILHIGLEKTCKFYIFDVFVREVLDYVRFPTHKTNFCNFSFTVT